MTIQLDQAALIFVDVINHFDFNGGEDLHRHSSEIVPYMVKLKRFAKKNQIPVIYVNDHYKLWTSDRNLLFQHCLNERSRQIIEPLRPEEGDFFLMKPMHSAFHQTPLRALLEDLGKTTLILSGFAGDICLLFTGQDAYMLNYDMWIPKNCTASESVAANEHALTLMHDVMNAHIDPI